jgi:F-box/TPR repeat protein Pof3
MSAEFLHFLLDRYSNDSGREQWDIEDPESLQTLSLSAARLWPERRFFGETGLCTSPRLVTKSLTSLNLSSTECTDDDIETFLTYPTSIQSIDLSSTKITGASLKMLADGLPTLRDLKADDCPGISSRDAVIYVEKRGIAVSCRTSDHVGSKKVRYRQ